MIITHKLKPMDLAQKQNTGRVDVVQGDKYSRNIEFTFMYNGLEWQIPDGTTAIVRYKKRQEAIMTLCLTAPRPIKSTGMS